MEEPMDLNELVRGAVEWAEAGIPVFPCKADKSPCTVNGHKDATTDPRAVRVMFQKYEGSVGLIGAAMGHESGLFCVDVDLYKGQGLEGWLKQLQSDGRLPETRIHKTARGGLHLFYRSETEWPNTKPRDGVEVKGEGGYVIVPPSRGYTEVSDAPAAKAPPALLAFLAEAKKERRQSTNQALEGAVLSGDDFHDSIVQLSSRMSAAGQSQLQIKQHINALLEASDARNPQHDRHSRWANLMRTDEVTRAITSGVSKFSPEVQADKLADALNSDKAQLEKAANIATAMFAPIVGEGSEDEREYDPEEFPYSEEDGYFAHEERALETNAAVVSGIVYQDEVTIVSADPKAGKTVFGIDVGLSVSCGIDLSSELRVKSQGPALYFGLEGRAAIRQRVAAWKAAKKEGGHKLPEQIPFFAVEKSANFYEEARRASEVAKIAAANTYFIRHGFPPIRLIVVDTLTRGMIGGNQNDADDTAKFFSFVGMLRDRGVTANIMVIHHKRKAQKGDSGEGPRGSSNILAECDVSLHMSKTDSIVKIHVADARSIEDGATYYREMVTIPLYTDADGDEVTSVYMRDVDMPEEADETSTDYAEASIHAERMKVVVGLGHGTHDAATVVAALHDAKLTPTPGGGVNLRWKSYKPGKPAAAAYVQEFLHNVFPRGGRNFGNVNVAAQYDDGAIDSVKVSPLS